MDHSAKIIKIMVTGKKSYQEYKPNKRNSKKYVFKCAFVALYTYGDLSDPNR